MKMKWWEKTVEYKFIQEFINLNSLIAPLDGNEEKAGDAIFSNDDKWVLIEFKKDKSSIASEKKKFNDYDKAKNALKDKDSHHIIIYGELNEEEKNITLKSQRYFAEIEKEINETLQVGIKTKEFKEYLEEFLSYKKGSEVKGGSDSYGFIVGITEEGDITKCLTLEEFSEEFNVLSLKQEITQTQSSTYQRGFF